MRVIWGLDRNFHRPKSPPIRLPQGQALAAKSAARMGHPSDVELPRRGSAFCEFLQRIEYAGPASGVVLASDGQVGKAAVRDFHVRAARLGRELPADHGAARGIVVPIRDPGVGEYAGRSVLEDLPVTLELAYVVHDDRAFFGGVAVVAAEARIHLPEFHGASRVR